MSPWALGAKPRSSGSVVGCMDEYAVEHNNSDVNVQPIMICAPESLRPANLLLSAEKTTCMMRACQKSVGPSPNENTVDQQ